MELRLSGMTGTVLAELDDPRGASHQAAITFGFSDSRERETEEFADELLAAPPHRPASVEVGW
jgi:hypothetical protein